MGPERPDDHTLESFGLFLNEVQTDYRKPLHSVYITGSALTADFDPKYSDINSVFVLREMDLQFLSALAPLGRKYGKKGIAAPLTMTPAYIKSSLDVFAIEFFNLKLLHHTVLGDDIFEGIELRRSDLRSQCERDLKVKLIALRQAFIRAAGDRKVLSQNMIRSIPAYIPLFRAIIFLLGQAPPLNNRDVLARLHEIANIDTGAFQAVLKQKTERRHLSLAELNTLFRDYYKAAEKLGDMMDAAVE